MLNRVKIILNNPSHPGNIGAVARAMKNMGFKSLYLVRPKFFPAEEATIRAAHAKDILENAIVFDNLKSAVSGCNLIFTTSSRDCSLPWPMLDAKDTANEIKIKLSENKDNNIAIVFGEERIGLTTENLQLGHYHIQIPGDKEYNVLNLSQAVQIICYEVRAAVINDKIEAKPEARLATNEEFESFFVALQDASYKVGFLNPKAPRLLLSRLRKIFLKANLDHIEINLLRGFLSSINKKID